MSHLLRRAGASLFIVWAVLSLTFVIGNVLPSDPARMAAGAQARPQDVAKVRGQLGLDRPLVVQYAIFWTRLVHPSLADPKIDRAHASCSALGPVHIDLGTSYQRRQPVAAVLAERLPRTMFLAVAATFVQVLLGVFSGVLAAARRHTKVDAAVVSASLLGISAPTFLLGLGLQYLFAYRLRLLPLDGYGTTLGEHLASVVLPALTLGIFGAAYYTRLVRDEMIDLLRADFVRTARAKGLSRFRVLVVHALRNALVPLVTVVALDLGALVGGAIVTESIFRWPGIGSLSVAALLDRDGPLVLGTVLVTAVAIVTANFVADLFYVAADPRLGGVNRKR